MKKRLLIIGALLWAAHSFALVLEGVVTLNDKGTFLLTDAEGTAYVILGMSNNPYLSNRLTPFLGKHVRVMSDGFKNLDYENLKYRLSGALTVKEIPQGE